METKSRNQLLLVLFIGVLMGALDIAIVGPALPALRAAFGVDDRALSWIFMIYVLFNLVGTPLMAKLSDTFGRRSIYVLDVVLFAAGSLVVALAQGFPMLLAGRAIQGLGAGGIFPVASAVIGDTFPPEKRGSALGLIGAVFGLAFIIGPILGGVLLMFGWRWLFIINLPIAAVVIALSLRILPTTRPPHRLPFDWLGMTALALFLSLLAYGINQIDTKNFAASIVSSEVAPFILAALVFLALFVLAERRAADPVLRLTLFKSRQISLASVLSAGAGLGEAGLVFMPALAVAALGVKASTASFLLMPVVLAMAVGSPVVGRFLDRYGSKVIIFGGTTLLAVGMILLSLSAASLVLFIVAGVVIGLGLAALLGAPIRYIMLNEAPRSERASAQGLTVIATSMGQLLSGAVVGAIAASQGGGVAGYSAAFLVIGIVAVGLVFLTFGLKNHATELATARATNASDIVVEGVPHMS